MDVVVIAAAQNIQHVVIIGVTVQQIIMIAILMVIVNVIHAVMELAV